MRYIIFVINTQLNSATSDEMAEIDVFNERLQTEGHWILAAGICGADLATVIDNRDNKALVSKGSLFKSDEFYNGFWIVECPNQDRAMQIAAAGSKACNRKVELRPFLEHP